MERKKEGSKHTQSLIRKTTFPALRYTEAARHDHVLLKDVVLPENSFICFDKGYVDYQQYEVFTGKKIWYVTRLKDNALYVAKQEFDIPDEAHPGVLKDEEIELAYGKNKGLRHKARRIVFWMEKINGYLSL
jgi:hypothetical protein